MTKKLHKARKQDAAEAGDDATVGWIAAGQGLETRKSAASKLHHWRKKGSEGASSQAKTIV